METVLKPLRNYNNMNVLIKIGIVMMILFNNETLLNNLSNSKMQPVFFVYIYIIMLFISRLITKKQIISTQPTLALFSMILLILISFIIDGVGFTTTNAYYLIVIGLIVGYAITSMCGINNFMIVYNNTLYVLSIASILATYIFRPIIISSPTLFPIVTNSAGVIFSNAHIAYIFRYRDILRNTSIFREPGVFAIFLIIAIAFELNKKRFNIYKQIVLIIALISTFSTPAYIAFVLLMVGNIISKNGVSKKKSCEHSDSDHSSNSIF